ncbi:HesA/MoeB/ThiF family protein [Deferrisoma camini]|uniref:HesA/MoeB/ThiF family protein n=1 Tax=Deferrisoma camini TaxID=1035120 RepID=UPI00046CAB79|nr:HesA/MoeB/ThiF family protein [Deferrisoma camini]
MTLTEEEVLRYSRQILLPEVGGKGQERLGEARVLVVGAGGLGSPAALYLAAAGVGTVGLCDADRVDLTNLQRQILHGTPDVGRPKVDSGAEALARLNPGVRVVRHPVRLTAANALEIVRDYDVVVDGTDTFPSKFLVNDACAAAGVPYVYAGILRFEGQMLTVVPGKGACYRCFFREPPPPGAVPTCAQAGILGAVAGVMGSLQALEVLKLLLGVGEPLVNRLLLFEGETLAFREVRVRRDPRCPACGDPPHRRPLADEAGAVCEAASGD